MSTTETLVAPASGLDDALSSLRVVDLGGPTHFFGHLLRLFGAEVIRLESARDHAEAVRDRAYERAYVLGKDMVSVDPGRPQDRTRVEELVADADIIVESLDVGDLWWPLAKRLMADAGSRWPVVVSITTFGRSGPLANLEGGDLIAQAASGFLYLTGFDDGPPMRLGAEQAWRLAEAEAAAAALIAHRSRHARGCGQHVDIAARDAMIRATVNAIPKFMLEGVVQRRVGNAWGVRVPPLRALWETRDGRLTFVFRGGMMGGRGNRAMVDWFGDHGMDVAEFDGIDFDALDIGDAHDRRVLDRLDDFLVEFLAARTTDEVFAEGLERGIVLAPVRRPKDVLADEHLLAREYWAASTDDGRGWRTGRVVKIDGCRRLELQAPAWHQTIADVLPRFGRQGPRSSTTPSGDRAGALDGLKVLDLGWVAAVPITTLTLAQHGARVIRLESSVRPDPTRTTGPYKKGVPSFSGAFAQINSNKQSVAVNIKHRSAREVVKRLVKWADVMTENFRPGTLEKLGLGEETLREWNPGLVLLRSSSMGQSGPLASLGTTGDMLQSMCGFTALTGPPETPVTPWGAWTDITVPPMAVAAILTALEKRDRDGSGTTMDMAQYESSLSFLADVLLEPDGPRSRRIGNRDVHRVPHGVYPCQGDDRWCAIAVRTNTHWRALCRVVGGRAPAGEDAELESRRAAEDAIDEWIASWTAVRSREDVVERLRGVSVPASMVLDSADLLQDEQLASRRYFQSADHALAGSVLAPGPSFVLSEEPWVLRLPGPDVGEHTWMVCTSDLGFSEEEVVNLMAEGVLE